MTHDSGAHRRYNPLLDEWVLCSPHRLNRPWQGSVEREPAEMNPAYDPACYLCPGNSRAGGAINPRYTETFAFDNDYPALTAHSDEPPERGALFRSHAETGRCRVLCFAPRHDLTLARMGASDIRAVVDSWARECEALSSASGIAHVQLFENKGELMGASNPHPHAQIWATQHVPTIPAKKALQQRLYFAEHGRDLLGEYLKQEARDGSRVVHTNAHWTAVVPFWAVWPFQTMLIPHRRVGALWQLDEAERYALAEVIRQVTVRYDGLFACDFPYSMGWAAAPVGSETDPALRLHAEFFPPLLRSASIRKFVVGYEMTGEAQRDLTPEDAASALQAQSPTHYRESPA